MWREKEEREDYARTQVHRGRGKKKDLDVNWKTRWVEFHKSFFFFYEIELVCAAKKKIKNVFFVIKRFFFVNHRSFKILIILMFMLNIVKRVYPGPRSPVVLPP